MTDPMHRTPPEKPEDSEKIVKLTARDVADAKRLLSRLSEDEEPGPATASPELLRQRLTGKALEILADRGRRAKVFGKAMFGEPAWEILLLLYALAGRERQSINRIAELSGASKTTALRWLAYLEQQHLVQREPHPTDRRTAFISLTDKGREKLELYLHDTIEAEG